MDCKPWIRSGVGMIIVAISCIISHMYCNSHRVYDTGDSIIMAMYFFGLIVGVVMVTLGFSLKS